MQISLKLSSSELYWKNSDFEKANLQYANVEHTIGVNANFKYANVQNVDFSYSNLQHADSDNADIRGTNFKQFCSQCDFYKCSIQRRNSL